MDIVKFQPEKISIYQVQFKMGMEIPETFCSNTSFS